MSLISSFEIIKVVVPDPRIFLFPASVADVEDFNNDTPDFNNCAKNL